MSVWLVLYWAFYWNLYHEVLGSNQRIYIGQTVEGAQQNCPSKLCAHRRSYCVTVNNKSYPIVIRKNGAYQCLKLKLVPNKDNCVSFKDLQECLRVVSDTNYRQSLYEKTSVFSQENHGMRMLVYILLQRLPTTGALCWKVQDIASEYYGFFIQASINSTSRKAVCLANNITETKVQCRKFSTSFECEQSLKDVYFITNQTNEVILKECSEEILDENNWCSQVSSYLNRYLTLTF